VEEVPLRLVHRQQLPDERRAVEVARIIGLGATRLDVGRPADVGWVVLADPEGNEFCVLSPKNSLID
jgi:hypothetical protein